MFETFNAFIGAALQVLNSRHVPAKITAKQPFTTLYGGQAFSVGQRWEPFIGGIAKSNLIAGQRQKFAVFRSVLLDPLHRNFFRL